MSTVFNRVAALFQDIQESVRIANALDKAYCDTSGFNHVPFGVDESTKVAANLAGLYAAHHAVEMLCAFHYGEVTEERYLSQLARFAEGHFGVTSGVIADMVANLAWRAGQPFRGLDRLTRPVNVPFTLLPTSERPKDRVQIQAAAQLLYAWIKSAEEANEAAA